MSHPRVPLLALNGLHKSFAGVPVLDNVSMTVRAGEVHALLGANGAGKSTLLKILSGAHKPDRGTIAFDGAVVRFATPAEAQARGIATIYQEFSQFPDLTVAENLRVGRLPRNRLGLVNWPGLEREADDALARLGVAIDPRRLVADLSVAEQQLVEIARALDAQARLIIMDEPTAALSASEVERLHAIVADLRVRGIGIIFVGHRLEEVVTICDRYTVLRDGRVAGTGDIAGATVDALIRLMVGRDLDGAVGKARAVGSAVLEARNLSLDGGAGPMRRRTVANVTFDVHAGEIVGLAGLVGAGRSEIARILFGADQPIAGEIFFEGRPVTLRDPGEAIRLGIGLVPEDRKRQSLFPGLDVVQNFGAAALGSFAGVFGWMTRREPAAFESFRSMLGIRLASSRQDIATLSGGNQQKVVLARWLVLRPKLLIVDEPTRGIDIAAKADVHRLLRDLAASGVAVLVISSDLPEMLSLSDRILTLRSGRLTGEIRAESASEEQLMRLMTLERPEAA